MYIFFVLKPEKPAKRAPHFFAFIVAEKLFQVQFLRVQFNGGHCVTKLAIFCTQTQGIRPSDNETYSCGGIRKKHMCKIHLDL